MSSCVWINLENQYVAKLFFIGEIDDCCIFSYEVICFLLLINSKRIQNVRQLLIIYTKKKLLPGKQKNKTKLYTIQATRLGGTLNRPLEASAGMAWNDPNGGLNLPRHLGNQIHDMSRLLHVSVWGQCYMCSTIMYGFSRVMWLFTRPGWHVSCACHAPWDHQMKFWLANSW